MNVYIYILVMAVVTYLIRMLPLALISKKIKSRFLRSFLYYVPYACLMAMTFPYVIYSTSSIVPALAGVAVAIILSLKEKGLIIVAVAASVTVFILDFMFF